MKKFTKVATLLVLMTGLAVSTGYGQDENGDGEYTKRAQTSMKFLSFSVDARAAALGDAMTGQEEASAIAMFYNPAAMARFEGTISAAAGMAQWIADINYNSAAVMFRPAGGLFGVFGVTAMLVDYGDLQGTIRFDNDAGFVETEVFTPSANVFGIGYARALTDRFVVGGNAKYASEDLGYARVSLKEGVDESAAGARADYEELEIKQSAFAFDFGVIYRTGFKSLTFAMTARNFSKDVVYEEAEETQEIPLIFRIGIALDLMDFTGMDKNMHSLMLAVDTERPRDYYEQVKVGAEYTLMNTFSLRAGYVTPSDEQGISFGAGIKMFGFGVDFAYTDFGIFDQVYRTTVKVAF
ncbi:MAG: PorV/PorQ family protein [Fidelibacterota bacterium]|nr:MAG: PorV/PorQ family protein [Candidatus Neomarinimicrobiota bacterium]